MTDAAGIRSENVGYRLREMPDGEYELLLSADAAWINDPARTLPVTIDPYVEVLGQTTGSDSVSEYDRWSRRNCDRIQYGDGLGQPSDRRYLRSFAVGADFERHACFGAASRERERRFLLAFEIV